MTDILLSLCKDTLCTRKTPLQYSKVLPTWEAKHKGSIAIKFVTNEPNGLLIYSTGPVNTEQKKKKKKKKKEEKKKK
ncbi:hypothetical protein M8J77_012167 [Diaphorina citri]|nr:hypothetical protein M8J77_012167 [Diaphorina citri]